MKKIILNLVLPVFLNFPALVFSQGFNYVNHAGSTGEDVATGVCTDASGNVYVTGYYGDSITLGGFVLHATSRDGFIVKYNPAGAALWAKRITNASTQAGYAIDCDNAGNIYVAGDYSGSASLDTFNLTSNGGSQDIFIAKLTSSGTVTWLKTMGSNASNDHVNGIAVDGSNNLYLTGEFSGNAAFGNGVSLTSINHPINGASIDCFTAKFNVSGICQWAAGGGSIGTDRSYDIDVDASGNSYITGFYQNNATFSGSVLNASGPVDVFVAGYNASGSLNLLFSAASPDYEAGYGITLDGLGNFYITGLHAGYLTFDTITVTPNGSYDMFLAKYTTSGDVQWVQSTLSSQWESGEAVAVDDKGNPYVSGTVYHGGTSMFNEIYMTSLGYHDPFIVKYNRFGEFQWATRGGSYDYDGPQDMALADSGKVYVAGYYSGSPATFGASTFNSAGGYDILLLKLRTDLYTGSISPVTFCAGQAVNVPFRSVIPMAAGNTYYAQLSDKKGRFSNAVTIGSLSTTATTGSISALIPDTIPEGTAYRIRVISTDSARTGADNGSNITIHALPSALITSAGTDFCPGDSLAIQAQTGAGYTFQWLNNFIPVSGATSSTYYAKQSGVYNVIVSNASGCNRTSGSISVTKRNNPNATITAVGSTSFCSGGSVSLNANTGNNFTYQWKKNGVLISGATLSTYQATASGTYKVTVTNVYGCSKTSSGTLVTVYSLPSASFTANGPVTFCNGDSVKFTANSGINYSYAWKKNGNFIPGATSQVYTAKTAGVYRVVVTKSNGCSKASATKTVTINCRLEEYADETFFIFPNPGTGDFILHTGQPGERLLVSVIHMTGQATWKKELFTDQSGMVSLSLHDLPSGLYFIELKDKNTRSVQKLVKTSE